MPKLGLSASFRFVLPCLSVFLFCSFADRTTVVTTDTAREFPRIANRAEWEARAAAIRQTILFRAGLWPQPERTPLNAHVFGRLERNGVAVEKVYFESVPGFFVTGNLYRPAGSNTAATYPAVLAPHGHHAYGRLASDEIFNEPLRAANLARQGYVVFTYDMVGYNDSFQVPHDYALPQAQLWSFSVLGVQLWNSIRALDFLASLPDVDPNRLSVSGASGGGTQTFLLAAVDERVKVAVPANMVSAYMQGGDNCENAAGLRLDYSNVEFAAAAAPRPMLLVSATGDWTRDNQRIEFPAIRDIYRLFGAEDHVQHVQFQAPHNFNRDGREASYAFLGRWLRQSSGVAGAVKEANLHIEMPANLLVWNGRERPAGLDAAGLLDYWRKLPADLFGVALAVAPETNATMPNMRVHSPALVKPTGAVVLAGVEDAELIAELNRIGRVVIFVEPFQETRDTNSRYFTTYNRTADQIRVSDLLAIGALAEKEYGSVDLVGAGPGGLWALVARAVTDSARGGVPKFRRTVADAARFPTTDESAYLERLFIPGILRAGGFQSVPKEDVLIHNAGGVFHAPGDLREAALPAAEIARWIEGRAR
jgi:dienelactone hydrolase